MICGAMIIQVQSVHVVYTNVAAVKERLIIFVIATMKSPITKDTRRSEHFAGEHVTDGNVGGEGFVKFCRWIPIAVQFNQIVQFTWLN